MRKTFLILGVSSIVMLTACKKDLKPTSGTEDFSSTNRAENPVAQAATDPYVSNEILVKFKKGVSATGRANALARIGGQVKEQVLTKMMERVGDEGFYVVHTPLAVLVAVGKMKGLEDIEYAEPNFVYQHEAELSDSYYTNGSLWGMYGDAFSPANQFGSQAAEAWAAGNTGSTGVYIGIIDEGIQYTHPDLNGQVWTNTFDPADGVDNDGNGYVDDMHGWDFDGNNNTIYDGGSRGSLDDHGTHVAGTIGAKANNGTGVVGVCWKVTLISGKFLGRRGGTTANAIKAVEYFTDLKTRHGINIVATNNSWGGGGSSKGLQDAIERANAANILFIAAAGNSSVNIDNSPSYPASYPNSNIIAVAAITNSGALASYSNYGSKTVHIAAPGSGVNSTTAFNTYSNYNGTSMATPHVTGGAALYASRHPGSNAAQIKGAILSGGVVTSTLSGKTFESKRLNVSSF